MLNEDYKLTIWLATWASEADWGGFKRGEELWAMSADSSLQQEAEKGERCVCMLEETTQQRR